MRPYTIDIKLRCHLLSSNIEKDINSIIEMLVTENFDDSCSQEAELMGYEYGTWYLFPVGDQTDLFVKKDLNE